LATFDQKSLSGGVSAYRRVLRKGIVFLKPDFGPRTCTILVLGPPLTPPQEEGDRKSYSIIALILLTPALTASSFCILK
jgi:hypothetical protein